MIPRRPTTKTKTWRIVWLAKANRARNADCERIPVLAGKRKRKVVQRDARFRDFLAEVRVPLERQVLDAVSFARGSEAKAMLTKIEKVLAPESAFVELHEDQVSHDRDLANGLARLLPLLSAYAGGKQQTYKKES